MADETLLYFRLVALMEIIPKKTPAAKIAFILDCKIGTVYTLRNIAKHSNGDADEMREYANRLSRESKARSRARAKEMTLSH